MPEDDFKTHYAKLLEIYEYRERLWSAREAELLGQVAEERARREALEKVAKYRTITLDTIIKEPVISTKQDNTVRFVNAGYVAISGYTEPEVIGNPITNLVRGLEFLTQFYEHPELIAAETHESLQKVPITLLTKDGKELSMTANVGFSPGETPGYHGVTFVCERNEWYKPFARLFTSPWFSHWHVIKANKYAEQGVLLLPDSPLESRLASPADLFLQEATKEVRKQTNRGVAIKFEGVTSCSNKIYELLVSVARVREGHFTCFVDEDSEILAGFKQAQFPDKHLKIIKKKNKEKKK